MKKPDIKPSQRLRGTPNKRQSEAEGNPLDFILRTIYRWLNSRFGLIGAALLALPVLAILQWGNIVKVPAVAAILEYAGELGSLPIADEGRFSIVLARLENDIDGSHRRLVRDTLQGLFKDNGVQVLVIDRTLRVDGSSAPQDATKSAHALARKTLSKMRADVLVWGEVLAEKADSPMRIHWTVKWPTDSASASNKYQLSPASYDLPDLFHRDLKEILNLLVQVEFFSLSNETQPLDSDMMMTLITRAGNVYLSQMRAGRDHLDLGLIVAAALQIYGERTGDQKAADTAVMALKKARQAYKDSKNSQKQVEVGVRLGTAQLSLGRVMNVGEEPLRDAAASFREVLALRSPTITGVDWRAVKGNLALTLSSQALEDKDMSKRNEAIAMYRDALKETEPPWAKTTTNALKLNLASELQAVAQKEDDVKGLEGVERMYQELLPLLAGKEPMHWATVQHNLGSTLLSLYDLSNDKSHLFNAIEAFKFALKERTRQKTPRYWNYSMRMLGTSLIRAGSIKDQATSHEEAVSVFRELSDHADRSNDGVGWADARFELGHALRLSGSRRSENDQLNEALRTLRDALSEHTRERVPDKWARTQYELGLTLKALGLRTDNSKVLREAETAHGATMSQLSLRGNPDALREVQESLNEVQSYLRTLDQRRSLPRRN